MAKRKWVHLIVSFLVLLHCSLWHDTSSFFSFLTWKIVYPRLLAEQAMEMSFPVLENNKVCDKGEWAIPIWERSCMGNWDDSLEGEEPLHSFIPAISKTDQLLGCPQFPMLNYTYRNLLHLLHLNPCVLQWHSSPLPFSRRWWMTIHPIHVSSTTQSPSFNYCMSNCGREPLVMSLHQCCP